MLIYKIAALAVYSSIATGSEFKFKQNSKKTEDELRNYMEFQKIAYNKDRLWTDYALYQKDYHAAWLLEEFSGVQQDGKAHDAKLFDLEDRAGLIRRLKEEDDKFSPWFESHIEPAEKKITEVAAPRELVDAGTVQPVQGQ